MFPGVKVGAHVDVLFRDQQTGQQMLVRTNRKCPACGEPLVGPVILVDDKQVHVACRRRPF